MEIDPTTLSDLEVFRSPDGSGGVFQLVDRTHTTLGRRALRRRFEHPMSDAVEIRRTQEAVRFLMRHPRLIRLEEEALAAVDGYLRSNISVGGDFPLGRRVEHVWIAVRYRDVFAELREGVRATGGLFRRLAELCRSIEGHAPPGLLAEMTGAVGRAAEAVLLVGGGQGDVPGVDRTLRGGLRDDIRGALDAVAELDALASMARATAELGWTLPEIVDRDPFLLDARGIYHPFVTDPVANPVRLTGGEPMVFLTGPNMAGKTTYLRTVALVALLAQVGMGVPAEEARLTPVEAVFTSLNPSDDLKAGLSYFLAEVMRVKAAATLLADGTRALVLFDEVFKGTNVKDALEASAEVILGFAGARRSGFVFSSHLSELGGVLRSNRKIRFCYFDGEIVKDAPHYGYQLKDGVSDKRFGLLLLRRAGIPELIDRIHGPRPHEERSGA
jgi:DNA mismatch repair protein MutS